MSKAVPGALKVVTKKGPLSGVTVADFTWVGAGAYTTKLLSDHGATVIRIESSTRVDALRMSPPFKDGIPGVNRSGYFSNRNTNKLSITLNMKTPEGMDVARRIIAKSDVVANNFRPGVMEKLGVGYEDCKKIKPDIIYLSMPMQGSSGPHAHYKGFGLTLNVLTGLYGLTGLPGREPVGTGTNYPDHIPNPGHGAFAVLAALWHRKRTGEGQWIDLSQFESSLGVMGEYLLAHAVTGQEFEPVGNDDPHAVPHGVFRCAGDDEWIALSVRTAEWQGLKRAVGAGALDDPGLQTFAGRRRRKDEVHAAVEAWTRLRPPAEAAAVLQSHGVPAAVVASVKTLVEEDVHLRERGYWVWLEHAEMGRTLYNGIPFRLSETPGEVAAPAPLLGEHTEYVCREFLGMSEEEFRAYEAAGVFQ